MPPAQKKVEPQARPFMFSFEPGQIFNLVVNGQFLPAYELLEKQGDLWVFRGSVQASPQTEVVGIPYHAIERIGLVNQR